MLASYTCVILGRTQNLLIILNVTMTMIAGVAKGSASQTKGTNVSKDPLYNQYRKKSNIIFSNNQTRPFFYFSSRLTNSGVCFREIISCHEDQDCMASKYNLTRCCRNHCCPAEYHHAWREFSCHSHVSCRQLRTGSHCCDKDGEIIKDFIDVESNPSDKRRCCFNHQV